MNLRQLLLILRLRWWLVLLVFSLVLGIAAAATWLLPKKYTSETTIIVDVRTDPLLATFAPQFASPAHMATQIEIIKSDRVAQRVVKMLGLSQSPEAVEQWRDETQGRIPMEAYFGAFLQKGLNIEAARGSNILNLSFASANPKFASAAANSYTRAYLDISSELRADPARQSSQYFAEQAKSLRSELEVAQARLTDYEKSKGIAVSGDRADLEAERLNALTGQLAAAQVEFAEANSRRANAGTEMSVDVQLSNVVAGLKGELSRVETKLSEISSVVGANHPTRIALENQASKIRQQISAEMRRVSGSTAAASRISGQKITELRALVDAQRKVVLSLRNERDEASVLRRDVETAQKAYEAVASRRSQASLESLADQAGARVLSPAVEPIEPSSPNMKKNLLTGLVLGVLLGLGAALALEFFDRRIRGASDLADIDGVPLLAVISSKPGKYDPVRRIPSLGYNRPAPRLTMDGGQA